MTLIEQLQSAQKDAMRAKDKLRLGTIRMALAAIKQREIDERITLTDADILGVLTKMVKQRQDAAQQFDGAGRLDLADNERAEIVVIETFLPQPLTDNEVNDFVAAAIIEVGAASMQDMGKVMAVLKPKVQGRTDMGALSTKIKAALTA